MPVPHSYAMVVRTGYEISFPHRAQWRSCSELNSRGWGLPAALHSNNAAVNLDFLTLAGMAIGILPTRTLLFIPPYLPIHGGCHADPTKIQSVSLLVGQRRLLEAGTIAGNTKPRSTFSNHRRHALKRHRQSLRHICF